ncbi:hypothetical protein, variant [Saprolegnia diclina VS20]|uniref:START domain-containing protein n=1 Tax=Saprolegnia diclina (strain VS20) TaxID=1156394 RepID=T0QRF9_SAPDV|nr:hypothetical protein, variant [Saprolegnia diclina VS20]EQC37321.1 hypothetical protein, variant [Saprolegnia diclina VS20]|eukprot:XP_008609483.1 hypothetical protein, variant [Saprolegnia diclina VS20]
MASNNELLLRTFPPTPPPMAPTSTASTPSPLPTAIESTDDFLLDLPSINKLLLSETSSTESDKETPTTKAATVVTANEDPYSRQHRYRKRQKDERQFLRDQVQSLTTQLRQLRDVKTVELASSSEWQKIARTQRVHAHQATLENTRLKRALEDQLKLANTLDQLLVKRPRLLFPTLDVVDWKFRKMPADPSAREASFHAMIDYAHSQVESILLQKGLRDATDGHHAINITTSDRDDCIVIDVQSVRVLDVDFLENANKCWSLWCEPEVTTTAKIPTVNIKVLDRFGPNAAYLQNIGSFGDEKPYLFMLSAVKRYVEKDRAVIVMRTVLEDALHPPPPGLFIGNHTSFCLLERLENGKCRRTMCMLGQLPIQAPGSGPLADEPPMMVCDYVLSHTTQTSHLIEDILGE